MSNTQKLFSFKGGVFTMITKEKEIQNDKERILKKFNFFSQSNSNNNNSQTNHSQSHSLNRSSKLSRNKSHSNNNKKTVSDSSNRSLNTSTKIKHKMTHSLVRPYINTRNKTAPKQLTTSKSYSHNNRNKSTTVSNNFNQLTSTKNKSASINNSNETEREVDNHMIRVNHSIISNELKINQEAKMSQDSLIAIQRNRVKEKTVISPGNSLNKGKLNNLYMNNPIDSSESDNFSNCEGIPQYQQIQIKNKKIQQLFSFNPKCDISNSLINDELNNYHVVSFNTEYKFINKIREENNSIIRINIKPFLRLSDYSLFYLLSFCYESYNSLVFNSNRYISSKINLAMNNIFYSIIQSFSEKYKSVIKLLKFRFVQKNTIVHKRTVPILDLVITAQITSTEMNKCIEIGYNYTSKKKEFENIWKFDIKQKNNVVIWFSSECEVFNENVHRFCYSQPILPFFTNDTIELNINIYSRNGFVNPFSIKWNELKVEDTPGGFYQKSMLKCPYQFNSLRACEVENMIHFWRGENTFVYNNPLINEFKKIFKRHFKIEKVNYDVSKIYLYKIRMRAESVGKIMKNKFINFDIEIVSKEEEVHNEIQNLFLLNSSFSTNQIQIRIYTIIIFYLTEL